mmetsp:Transcript_129035/g.413415  ORF Transcript_129035/g.413415 Transcript_129035/m.413415 type:complete len:224 (-) Transcript_129035:509-1180(-)
MVPGATRAIGLSSISATTYAQWLVTFCVCTSTTFSSSTTSLVHIAKPEKSFASSAFFLEMSNLSDLSSTAFVAPGWQNSNDSKTCGSDRKTRSLVLDRSRRGRSVPSAALPLLMTPRFAAKLMIRCSVYLMGATSVCTHRGIIFGHELPGASLRKRFSASLMIGSTPSCVAMLPISSDTMRSTFSGRSTFMESPVMTSMILSSFSFFTVSRAFCAASGLISMA